MAAGCSSDLDVVAAAGDLGHIHDLVLTADDDLLVASHTGLYRIEAQERAVLAGPEQHDLMAMAAPDDGTIVASGHPDLRLEEYRVADKKALLGLVESSDDGRTWCQIGLLGEADIHALLPTQEGLLAAESSGQIMLRLPDGTWEERGNVVAADLAVDPDEPDRIVATDFDGILWASTDGGRSWEVVDGAPSLVEVEWTVGGGFLAIDSKGQIWTASTPAGPWDEMATGPADPETLLVDRAETWWVASEGGRISRSEDGGTTWSDVLRALPHPGLDEPVARSVGSTVIPAAPEAATSGG